ncbi:type II toxin-antitoxin system RelE/ParE family toxin [Neorhizobium sp. JUb45]|uniref:type II toxin-antitoxin system RelE/ParE family toxin n=1 Tax=unclassified Neorhizobium TaxID=2629175 RepID=UPI00104583D0|nr:type II toxin-antitoxin system RelE/ParE family toxin [Neorhizobium sp. JUb45]TCR07204.1 toxin ParE1/3/4 [Neorhizobium sp. JUb45]
MRHIRWSTAAEADFDEIITFIAAANHVAAEKIEQLIEDRVDRLRDFPNLGRIGKPENTRELLIIGTPYFAVYILDSDPLVLRILHGAQRWPPTDPE